MSPDLLDDLLDRSAPATRAAVDDAMRVMVADAASQARPLRPRRRRTRLAVGGGLAVLLASGAGVAAATDGFGIWSITDPVGAVSFTMANGLACELRFSEYKVGDYLAEQHGDPAFLADVNRTLEEWYASTDVVREAEALLPAQREHLAAMTEDAQDDPGADMSALTAEEQSAEIEHRAWSREWLAWDLAVSELETRALTVAGFSVDDDRFVGSERSGQIQCLDQDGKPYVPGAGS